MEKLFLVSSGCRLVICPILKVHIQPRFRLTVLKVHIACAPAPATPCLPQLGHTTSGRLGGTGGAGGTGGTENGGLHAEDLIAVVPLITFEQRENNCELTATVHTSRPR